MRKKSEPKSKRPPQKNRDLPATQGMLFELRDELKAEIRAGVSEMKALFHEAMLRFEAQHADNKATLEHLNSLYERQDRVEADVATMKSTLSDLANAARPSKGKA